MYSHGPIPFPLDVNSGRRKSFDGTNGYNSDGDSRISRSTGNRELPTPYSKKYAQRICQIKERREEKEERRKSDVLAQRSSGLPFRVSSADHTSSHHTRRSFGFITPARSQSPGMHRGRSRSASVDSRASAVSRSRSPSASSVGSRSRRGDFSRELQLQRDLQAEQQQKEALKQTRKEYYLKLLKSKNTPWLPSNNKPDEQPKHVKVNHNLVDMAIRQKAWRRSPWAGAISVEARESLQLPPPGSPSLPYYGQIASPSSHSERDDGAQASQVSHMLSSSVGASMHASALGPPAKALQRKVVLHKQSAHLALAVRIINSVKGQQSKYGILVLKRSGTKTDLVSAIEKQFNVHGQISDISIASQSGYSETATIASLSMGTIAETPVVDENSDIIVYLGGALFQQGGGAGHGHLFSQPLRDFRSKHHAAELQHKQAHGLLDKDDMMFFDSISNNIQAFDEYTRSQLAGRVSNGSGERYRDFDRKKHAFSHESHAVLGVPSAFEVDLSAIAPGSSPGQRVDEVEEDDSKLRDGERMGQSELLYNYYLPSPGLVKGENPLRSSTDGDELRSPPVVDVLLGAPMDLQDPDEPANTKTHVYTEDCSPCGQSSVPSSPIQEMATAPPPNHPFQVPGSSAGTSGNRTANIERQLDLIALLDDDRQRAPVTAASPKGGSMGAPKLRLDVSLLESKAANVAATRTGDRFDHVLNRLDTVYDRLSKQLPRRYQPTVVSAHTRTAPARSQSRSISPPPPLLNSECTFSPQLLGYTPPLGKRKSATKSMERAEEQHLERFEWKNEMRRREEESRAKNFAWREPAGSEREERRSRNGDGDAAAAERASAPVHESFLDLSALLG